MSALSLFVLKLAGVLAAPLAVALALARFPSRKLIWLAVVPAAVSGGLLLLERLFWPLAALDVLLLAVAAIDLATLPRRGSSTSNARRSAWPRCGSGTPWG